MVLYTKTLVSMESKDIMKNYIEIVNKINTIDENLTKYQIYKLHLYKELLQNLYNNNNNNYEEFFILLNNNINSREKLKYNDFDSIFVFITYEYINILYDKYLTTKDKKFYYQIKTIINIIPNESYVKFIKLEYLNILYYIEDINNKFSIIKIDIKKINEDIDIKYINNIIKEILHYIKNFLKLLLNTDIKEHIQDNIKYITIFTKNYLNFFNKMTDYTDNFRSISKDPEFILPFDKNIEKLFLEINKKYEKFNEQKIT